MIKDHLADQNKGKYVDYQNPSELAEILALDEAGGQTDWDQTFSYLEQSKRRTVFTTINNKH